MSNPSDGTEQVSNSPGSQQSERHQQSKQRSAGDVFLSAVVIFARVLQLGLVAFAVIFVVGSLQMPAFQAVFVWVFALVLLAFALVVQAIIAGVKARWSQ